MLSPRQEFRFARQQELLEQIDESGGPWPAPTLLLDLGIEDGLSGVQIKGKWPSATLVGVELHQEHCAEAPECYDLVYNQEAYAHLFSSYHVYDVTICAELIEHMPKETGELFLETLEKFTRYAILTTPLGFMRQGEIKGNPHQVHRSGWEPEEFSQRGWEVPVISEEHRLIVATWGL